MNLLFPKGMRIFGKIQRFRRPRTADVDVKSGVRVRENALRKYETAHPGVLFPGGQAVTGRLGGPRQCGFPVMKEGKGRVGIGWGIWRGPVGGGGSTVAAPAPWTGSPPADSNRRVAPTPGASERGWLDGMAGTCIGVSPGFRPSSASSVTNYARLLQGEFQTAPTLSFAGVAIRVATTSVKPAGVG